MSFFSAVVVTVSDRSYRGQRPDEAGPLVAELLREAGYTVVRTAPVSYTHLDMYQIGG